MSGQWSREEIGAAFEQHKRDVVEIGSSWDAGDNLWSLEEDADNPVNFPPMVKWYAERSYELDSASEDAVAFSKNMKWELG